MKTWLFTSTFLSGLMAGLFYAYSCSVNKGLKSLNDQEYLSAMQSINKAILNPWFFMSFMGLLLVYPVSTYVLYKSDGGFSFYLMAVASVIYFIGVFGITVVGNVPLNNQLENFNISESSNGQIAAMRETFEGSWNFFHSLRTSASLISFGLTVLSFLNLKNKA